MGKKWLSVKLSRPHRRKKHDVKGYKQNTSKAHRNKAHKRRPRRTDKQIKAANKRAKTQTKKNKVKSKLKQKTLSGSSKGVPKKYFKQLERRKK